MLLLCSPLSGCFPGTGAAPAPPVPDVQPDVTPAPDTPSPPAPAADLLGFDVSLPPLFKDLPDAAQRKADLAAIATEMAAQIEYDGTKSEPLALNTTQVLQKFGVMNDYALRGRKVAPPGFGDAVKAVTQSQLEADGLGHELTEDHSGETYRATSIKIFKAIATVLSK